MQKELKQYFIDNGVKQTWFAKQLGITYGHFWAILENRDMSSEMACDVERLTGGKVTVKQLLNNNKDRS